MAVKYGTHDRFYWTKEYTHDVFREMVELMSTILWPYLRALDELAELMDSIGLIVDDTDPCNYLQAEVKLRAGRGHLNHRYNPENYQLLNSKHADDLPKISDMSVKTKRGFFGLTPTGRLSTQNRGRGDYLSDWTSMTEEMVEYQATTLKWAIDKLEFYMKQYAAGRPLEESDQYMQQIIDMGALRNIERIRVYLGVDTDA